MKVGLAILDAVVPNPICRRQPILEFGDRVSGENILDDLRHRLVLEDLAIRRTRQIPQPGVDTRPVTSVAPLSAETAELADQTVEVAGAAAGKLVANGHPLSQQLLVVDRGILAQQLQIEGERRPTCSTA